MNRRHALSILSASSFAACAPLPVFPTNPNEEEDFWKQVRAQFPLTQDRVYFNTGGLGAASYPVLDAVYRTMMAQQTIGETGHNLIDPVREKVAQFFGVKSSEIAFVRNATEGNATIASGLKLHAGDEVIFERHAHPSGAIPWMVQAKERGINVKAFTPSATSQAENLNRIEALISPKTRLIQVSHVTAPTGILFDVKAIANLAKSKGIWFHIDGAQSAGMLDFKISDLGCDSFTTSSHKWMGAPHGTGFLWIREDRLDEVVPTDVGSYSDSKYQIPDVFEYNLKAQRYEAGTRDAAQIVGIGVAVDFLARIGMSRIEARGRALAQYLQNKLREIPSVEVLTPQNPSMMGAITTFKSSKMPYNEINAKFGSEYKLRCRIVTEDNLNALRISTHLYNNFAECDRAIEAARKVLG